MLTLNWSKQKLRASDDSQIVQVVCGGLVLKSRSLGCKSKSLFVLPGSPHSEESVQKRTEGLLPIESVRKTGHRPIPRKWNRTKTKGSQVTWVVKDSTFHGQQGDKPADCEKGLGGGLGTRREKRGG